MIRSFIIGLALSFLVLPVASIADDQTSDDAEKKATQAAESWLALVDQQKYGESWELAATYFKNAVSEEDFAKSLTAARTPLGSMKLRKLKSKEFRTSLPGAPDGKYVIIQFETSFANKTEATETITPMLDKDGEWRTSGYFVK